MKEIYRHKNFDTINKKFEEAKKDEFSDCPWTKFIPIHKDISKGRCPICEQKLDEIGERHTGSSIDHFRPRDNYKFLECEESNYILMCKGCNDVYKKSEFPLDTDFVATNLTQLCSEKPLLLNVREEDPLDYFELVFTEKYLPYPILELKRKRDLNKSSYAYRKAEETIRLFLLGKCHKQEPKESEKSLYKTFSERMETLHLHYDTLYELAKAIDEEKDFEEILQNNPKLMEYGFFKFLIHGQFRIE